LGRINDINCDALTMPLIHWRDEEIVWFLVCVDWLTWWTVGRP